MRGLAPSSHSRSTSLSQEPIASLCGSPARPTTRWSLRLDDQPATLDRVSLYAPQMVAADPLTMGEHTLTAGPHRLRFTIVGAHPMAKPDYVVGIDAIRLERLK